MTEEQLPWPSSRNSTSLRIVNEKAIREHALACSAKFRNGKFTRVGQDFVDEVLADVEAIVRKLNSDYPTLHTPLPLNNAASLVTRNLLDKIADALNESLARLIQNKVQKQPSCGVTLSRTR